MTNEQGSLAFEIGSIFQLSNNRILNFLPKRFVWWTSTAKCRKKVGDFIQVSFLKRSQIRAIFQIRKPEKSSAISSDFSLVFAPSLSWAKSFPSFGRAAKEKAGLNFNSQFFLLFRVLCFGDHPTPSLLDTSRLTLSGIEFISWFIEIRIQVRIYPSNPIVLFFFSGDDRARRGPLLVNYSTVILDFRANRQNFGKFKGVFKFHHGKQRNLKQNSQR